MSRTLTTVVAAAWLGWGWTQAPAAFAAPINLAPIYGAASQSSTAYSDAGYNGSGPASRAIDGNTNGNYFGGSVTHTGFDKNGFWQVSLGKNFDLTDIQIFNRTDCCTDRLTNFTLSVTDASNSTVFTHIYTGAIIPSFDVPLSLGTVGQVVRVQLNGTNFLHLAEVKVFGTAITPVNPVPEPGTLLLLAGLLAATGLMVRSRGRV